ncbi:hypothetical protein [Aestuariibaculum suncheonense]|uniref:Uncharacterized protein n=1 Tax=Aestuariibaculum suncheonense TaxID=1028745 RepID=A0A8J6QFT3_9FLAO|nr:hypothetical protein [Aestuariibaculum suncheonense]MBD0835923.1 hypothetical protein [Aestuariibaculum suncheonense]
MKRITFILIFVFQLNSFAQSNDLVGDYKLTLGKEESHLIEYTLTLNQDGTFVFHSYNDMKSGKPPVVNKYGKGIWLYENKVVSFFTDKEKHFDEKYTLDLNNSKARFVVKSARDKSDRIIKTRLQFFASELFWIESIEMFKL